MSAKKSTKRDQYTVVLEDIRSHNKVFGEALSMVDDKVTKLDQRVGQLDQRVGQLDQRVGQLDQRVGQLDQRVGGVESDLDFIKGELALIRHNQVTREEFKFLETRVLRLEKQRR